jgi:hypothetical protein
LEPGTVASVSFGESRAVVIGEWQRGEEVLQGSGSGQTKLIHDFKDFPVTKLEVKGW